MSRITKARSVVAAAAVSALFATAACGTSSSDEGAEGGGNTDAQAMQELGETEGEVSILAWPGYVEDDWAKPFEEATGCTVNSKVYGTSDEALNLAKQGGYDVVAASGDLTLRLIAGGQVAPVNTDLVPNYENVFDFLKDQPWNTVDGVNYGVPHGYGANLLQYNTDVIEEEPTSWDVVFDKASQYKGKVTAYDSPIYIADAAMYLMAHEPDLGIENPYALDQDQLQAAVDLLKDQKSNVGEYWSDYTKSATSFKSGDTVVGTTWQVINNVIDQDKIKVTLPEEGATGWNDTWMLTADAEHPNCAYAWFNHIESPKYNAMATEYFGEAPNNPEACDFASDENFCESYHAGDEEFASKLYYWTTPTKECLDGRTDVECTDYGQWTRAWQQIKG